MKTLYICGNYESLLKELQNVDMPYTYDTRTYKELTQSLNSKQSINVKLNAINNSDFIIICVYNKYNLTPEDIFTIGYVTSLNKQLLVLGELSHAHPNYWILYSIPNIKFDYPFELIEYLAQSL